MSSTPPEEPWDRPPAPPPPPGGGYPPPPPPGGGYPPPPPPGGGYPPPPPPGGGYPPPPGGGYPGGGYPGGAYPGGGYPGGSYPTGPGAKGWTAYGPASGWWQRVGATIIDGLVLIVPYLIVDIAGGRALGTILSLAISAVYVTLMLSRRGQTLGNMAVGTRVVDAATGGPIGAGKAFGRWAVQQVLAILFFIPGLIDDLWPLWDGQNQALHDKAVGTLVLRVNR